MLSLMLHIILFNLEVARILLILIEIAVVTLVVLLSIDMAFGLYKSTREENARQEARDKELVKEKLRAHKEETADGGFFEESFENGFDEVGELIYRGSHRFPTRDDDVADAEIFNNTEEL
jgi:hypothetical protein